MRPAAAQAVHVGRGGGEETRSAGATEEAGGGALQQAAGQRAAGGVSPVRLQSACSIIQIDMEGKARRKKECIKGLTQQITARLDFNLD